jgi:O-acetyl-ADP-ribose deacetylase (regulator of RNase III)
MAIPNAIRSVFRQVKQQFTGKRIGYPKIGAGLAKGDWSIVTSIIEEELAGENHTYVEFISQL